MKIKLIHLTHSVWHVRCLPQFSGGTFSWYAKNKVINYKFIYKTCNLSKLHIFPSVVMYHTSIVHETHHSSAWVMQIIQHVEKRMNSVCAFVVCWFFFLSFSRYGTLYSRYVAVCIYSSAVSCFVRRVCNQTYWLLTQVLEDYECVQVRYQMKFTRNHSISS